MRPTRVLAYCRVSSEDQERSGTSLQGQREEIARHCASLGWPAPRYFVEAKSAADADLDNRPQARAVLEEARSGDIVIVAKQDRWTRNAMLYMQSERALRAAGATFFSLAEQFDRSVPEGRFAANISATASEFERERIFERTVGARRRLRDQGCWTEGVAPVGYRRDKATRRLVIHESEAEVVRGIFAACIGSPDRPGLGIEPIARDLRDRGVTSQSGLRKWDRKSVSTILDARWYLGEIKRTDGTWQAAHPPIVTPEAFEAARLAREDRSNGGSPATENARTQQWLLRGIARCGTCGTRIGASYGGDGYYVCGGRRKHTCPEPYTPRLPVDEEVCRLTVERLEALRDRLAKAKPTNRQAASTDGADVTKSLTAAKAKRVRAVTLAVDGVLSRDDLRTRLAALDVEIARLESRTRDVGRQERMRDPAVRAEVLAVVDQIRRRWDRLDMAARRAAVAMLAESIEMNAEGAKVTWRAEEMLVAATDAQFLFLGEVAAKQIRNALAAMRRERRKGGRS